MKSQREAQLEKLLEVAVYMLEKGETPNGESYSDLISNMKEILPPKNSVTVDDVSPDNKLK